MFEKFKVFFTYIQQNTFFTCIIVAAFLLTMLFSFAIIFHKIKVKAWKGLIPIYNIMVLLEVLDIPVWMVLLLFIPFVNGIGIPFMLIIMGWKLGKYCHKNVIMRLGLILLAPLFYPLLAASYIDLDGNAPIEIVELPKDFSLDEVEVADIDVSPAITLTEETIAQLAPPLQTRVINVPKKEKVEYGNPNSKKVNPTADDLTFDYTSLYGDEPKEVKQEEAMNQEEVPVTLEEEKVEETVPEPVIEQEEEDVPFVPVVHDVALEEANPVETMGAIPINKRDENNRKKKKKKQEEIEEKVEENSTVTEETNALRDTTTPDSVSESSEKMLSINEIPSTIQAPIVDQLKEELEKENMEMENTSAETPVEETQTPLEVELPKEEPVKEEVVESTPVETPVEETQTPSEVELPKEESVKEEVVESAPVEVPVEETQTPLEVELPQEEPVKEEVVENTPVETTVEEIPISPVVPEEVAEVTSEPEKNTEEVIPTPAEPVSDSNLETENTAMPNLAPSPFDDTLPTLAPPPEFHEEEVVPEETKVEVAPAQNILEMDDDALVEVDVPEVQEIVSMSIAEPESLPVGILQIEKPEVEETKVTEPSLSPNEIQPSIVADESEPTIGIDSIENETVTMSREEAMFGKRKFFLDSNPTFIPPQPQQPMMQQPMPNMGMNMMTNGQPMNSMPNGMMYPTNNMPNMGMNMNYQPTMMQPGMPQPGYGMQPDYTSIFQANPQNGGPLLRPVDNGTGPSDMKVCPMCRTQLKADCPTCVICGYRF